MIGLRKSLAEGPVVLVSVLLTMMGAVLLPDPFADAALAAYLVIALLLVLGVGEESLIRLLWRARPVTPVQWRILVASVEHLNPSVRVWVIGRGYVDAFPVGRRGIVVTSGMLDQLVTGQLPHRMATALLVGAQGQLRAGLSRRDPALRLVCLPFWLVGVPGAALGFSRVFRLGWMLRPVVFSISIVQTWQLGLPWMSAALAGLLAATYLVPRWRRQWRRVQVRVFDEAVVAAGRGADLAAWLRFVVGAAQRDRIVALENPRVVSRACAESPPWWSSGGSESAR